MSSFLRILFFKYSFLLSSARLQKIIRELPLGELNELVLSGSVAPLPPKILALDLEDLVVLLDFSSRLRSMIHQNSPDVTMGML